MEAALFEERQENYQRALSIIEKGIERSGKHPPLWFARLRVLEKMLHSATSMLQDDQRDEARYRKLEEIRHTVEIGRTKVTQVHVVLQYKYFVRYTIIYICVFQYLSIFRLAYCNFS